MGWVRENRAMPASEKRTFSLPAEQARYIDALVEAGTYATASEVVRAGLRALQERDAAVERWLREEVVPVAEAMEADPRRGIPAEQAMAELRALHERRMKERAG
jgi:antitoxin ParD1/3/4